MVAWLLKKARGNFAALRSTSCRENWETSANGGALITRCSPIANSCKLRTFDGPAPSPNRGSALHRRASFRDLCDCRNLLGWLTLQRGSLGSFPACILRLSKFLVDVRQKRMRLRRLRIGLRCSDQFRQCRRRIALPE